MSPPPIAAAVAVLAALGLGTGVVVKTGSKDICEQRDPHGSAQPESAERHRDAMHPEQTGLYRAHLAVSKGQP